MRVLILGCGPAGLIAAHAAENMYANVLIFSRARPSHMFGAQYLHSPIPGISMPEHHFKIRYELEGSVEGYHDKQYGRHTPASLGGFGVKRVSPQDLRGIHPAWDIRAAYDKLWARFGPRVHDVNLTSPEEIDRLVTWAKADVVISTIPATSMCLEGHSFGAEMIWSSDQAMRPLPDNTVVCNGHEAPAWYRAANIQGHNTVEWPHSVKPPLPQSHLWEVVKPISNNCTCFPDVVRMGRYGRWTKGVLSHQAFNETQTALRVRQGRLF